MIRNIHRLTLIYHGSSGDTREVILDRSSPFRQKEKNPKLKMFNIMSDEKS